MTCQPNLPHRVVGGRTRKVCHFNSLGGRGGSKCNDNGREMVHKNISETTCFKNEENTKEWLVSQNKKEWNRSSQMHLFRMFYWNCNCNFNNLLKIPLYWAVQQTQCNGYNAWLSMPMITGVGSKLCFSWAQQIRNVPPCSDFCWRVASTPMQALGQLPIAPQGCSAAIESHNNIRSAQFNSFHSNS